MSHQFSIHQQVFLENMQLATQRFRNDFLNLLREFSIDLQSSIPREEVILNFKQKREQLEDIYTQEFKQAKRYMLNYNS